MTKTELRVHIRWMIRRDMHEVLEIERAAFPFPWTEEDFIRCLRQRNCIGMVAEHRDRVVGFMVYELHKSYLRLLNFAVAPDQQAQGIGRQLVDKLKGKLSRQRRTMLAAEVCEFNLDAQLFFKRMGFKATGVLHGFYENSDQDAYRMEYRL